MEHFDWLKGFIFPYINFTIFAYLAYRFFKKPVLQMVGNRKRDFQQLLSDAKKAREDASRQNELLEKRLAQLDHEIAQISAKARADAEFEAKGLLADGERLSIHLREEARRIADAEIKRARETLRSEILAEVKANVTSRVKAELDDTAQLELARRRATQLSDVEVGVRG